MFPIENKIMKPSIVILSTKIQSLFRQYKQNYIFNNLKRAIWIIQYKFRHKKSKTHQLIKTSKYLKIYIDYNAFAIDIQKYTRMFLTKKKYKKQIKNIQSISEYYELNSDSETSTSTLYSKTSVNNTTTNIDGLGYTSSEYSIENESDEESEDLFDCLIKPKIKKIQEVKKPKITTKKISKLKKRKCGICKESGHTRNKCNQTYYHAKKYTKGQMNKALKKFIECHQNIPEVLKKNYRQLVEKCYEIYGHKLYRNYLHMKENFTTRDLERYKLVTEVRNRFDGNAEKAGYINILKSVSERYDINYIWANPKDF